MKNVKTQSVLSRLEFDAAYHSKFNATEASSENEVGPAQYFYNASTYTTTINVASPATVGQLRYKFDGVARGDVINVTGLIQNVSCGSISVVVEELSDAGAVLSVQASFVINAPADGSFKLVNANVVFRSENGGRSVRVAVGAYAASGGLFRLRDIRVSVASSIGDPVPTPVAALKTQVGAAWWHNGVWAARSDWPNSGFTMANTATTASVTFNTPFTLKPVVHVGEITSVTGGKKNAKVYNVSPQGFELAFYDENGAIIAPAAYTNDMFFNWSAIG